MKSVAAHLVCATLVVRKQLVGMRTEMINQIRGLMKIFGLILPKGSGARFEASVRARLADHAELGTVIEPLLAGWRALDDQSPPSNASWCGARRHEVCHRLMTVPGVGPLTALVVSEGLGHQAGQANRAKKAKAALARTLAAVLHRLRQHGTTFRWTAEASA